MECGNSSKCDSCMFACTFTQSLPQPSKPLGEDTPSSGLPTASSSGQGNSVEGHDQQKTRLIQQQLVLLLHANKCLQRERENPAHTCNLQYCRTMKDVLRHMMRCTESQNCTCKQRSTLLLLASQHIHVLYVCVYIRTYVRTCMYVYLSTYVHMHVLTYKDMLSCSACVHMILYILSCVCLPSDGHCVSSRQIIMHWKQCGRSDCSICTPVKGVIKPGSVHGEWVEWARMNVGVEIHTYVCTVGRMISECGCAYVRTYLCTWFYTYVRAYVCMHFYIHSYIHMQ